MTDANKNFCTFCGGGGDDAAPSPLSADADIVMVICQDCGGATARSASITSGASG